MFGKRQPAVAGRFYPSDPETCGRMVDEMLLGVDTPAAPGAIVPHAGWVYSGRTAARGIAGVAAYKPETVVIFGATHSGSRNPASVYAAGIWETPLGKLEIDSELADQLTSGAGLVADPAPHRHEHAIEVQLPFIQRLIPDVKIVPIAVLPEQAAEDVGRFCGRQANKSERRVAFLASTDLTHYGPSFGFEPHGHGREGVRWAKEVNDRRFIDLVVRMEAGSVVSEAAINHNACGAGAVAAMIGAMHELGCTRYVELEHTCSADIERGEGVQAVNSVGYAAGIFLKAG
ncbi:MAG: AmmeMemoRadiSam system protein B [Planctomycetota bacterium]